MHDTPRVKGCVIAYFEDGTLCADCKYCVRFIVYTFAINSVEEATAHS